MQDEFEGNAGRIRRDRRGNHHLNDLSVVPGRIVVTPSGLDLKLNRPSGEVLREKQKGKSRGEKQDRRRCP
jgi:hypothetical protein